MEKTGTKEYWSMTEGVFNCLIDKKRTNAFRKAIKKTVTPGDVVVDMGTGSGVLAMFAAKAGAKKVYAVEIDPNNIINLKNTFKLNGFDDVIEVVSGDIRKIKTPEKVDVIIGEMIATGLIEELQVSAMNNMLACGKKNVKVLLNTYEVFIDVVNNPDKFYGHAFKVLRYEYPDENEIKSKSLSKKHKIASFNFGKKVTKTRVNAKIQIPIVNSGTANGVRISGKTTFFDGSTLEATFAYDYPIILPIEDVRVTKGQVLETSVSYTANKGMGTLKYNVKHKT